MELLEGIWDDLVGKAYSFVIKDKCDRLIGVALNFDANDEPEPVVESELSKIFEFLEFVEAPIKYDISYCWDFLKCYTKFNCNACCFYFQKSPSNESSHSSFIYDGNA